MGSKFVLIGFYSSNFYRLLTKTFDEFRHVSSAMNDSVYNNLISSKFMYYFITPDLDVTKISVFSKPGLIRKSLRLSPGWFNSTKKCE